MASTLEYLLEIKKAVDSLVAVGVPITNVEYTNIILARLNKAYHPFITMVTTKDPPYTIPNLKALLMALDSIIEKLKKPDMSPAQVQLSQATTFNTKLN
ncbi:hypothetical protein AHAS_Ahas11G0228600 [Arachis hypogaea]